MIFYNFIVVNLKLKVMKRLFYSLFGLLIISASFVSCSNELNYVVQEDNALSLQTRSLEEKGDIIPVEESPYKRKDASVLSINENSSFFDIREMDVNIIVRENTHNADARYLTSNGVQKEVTVAPKNDSGNQNFKLYIMPLTGYIYIKDYEGHLLSMGVYTSDPNTRVLYIKDDDSTVGACWDFLRGEERAFSNILENADAIEQGDGGWMDVYNEVLGVKDSKLYFDKYRNSATQEFEIRVLEELSIVPKADNPSYDLANVNPEEKPSYILRGTVHNNGTTSSQMTIQYTEGAKVSSSFAENNSYTTNVSGNTGISTPIFSIGGSVSTSNTYGFTYTSGSEKNISYMFNQVVTVEPGTTVQVTAVVKNYNVSCDYNVLVEGVKSGRQFTIYGRWNGISCADVDYDISVVNKNGGLIKTYKVKGKVGEPFNLDE